MAAPAVRMTVRWFVPLGESRCITQALHRIMIAARAERGCLTCSVATEAGRQVGVRYVEEWVNEEVLQRQLRSDRFASLATLMETATEAPSLEIQLPTGIRGLDYVEEVRGTN